MNIYDFGQIFQDIYMLILLTKYITNKKNVSDINENVKSYDGHLVREIYFFYIFIGIQNNFSKTGQIVCAYKSAPT